MNAEQCTVTSFVCSYLQNVLHGARAADNSLVFSSLRNLNFLMKEFPVLSIFAPL